MKDDEKFAWYLYTIVAGICMFTVGVLGYIIYKVIKKVGANDKIIPTMLLMLQLSAISR